MAESVQILVGAPDPVAVHVSTPTVQILCVGQVGPPGAGGSGGSVVSIVAGAGIAVDATDPAHPIVTAEVTQTELDAEAAASRAFAIAMGVAL